VRGLVLPKERIIEEYITLNGVAQSSARGAKVVQLSSENDIPNNNVVTFGDFVNSLPN